MAKDDLAVLRTLGFERFAVAGHDRGARVGFRMALDHPEARAECIRCTTPAQMHAVCEDHRATVSVDLAMDSEDFGKKTIACPVLVLWGSNSRGGRHFKVLDAWAPWAPDLRGWAIPTGHDPAEHRPDLVYDPFWRFFAGGEPVPFAG